MSSLFDKEDLEDTKRVIMEQEFLFSGVRVARSLVFCVVFCRSLLVFLSFFFGPLNLQSIIDLRLLITTFGILDLRLLITTFVPLVS
jgi:hypothetical protein